MALTRNKKKSIPAKAVDVLPTKAVAALPAKAAKRVGKKRWHDMESSQRATLVAAGVVQVSMAAAAWIDLARRPSEKVRGPKALWALVISVNVVGPVLYLLAGRTSGDAPSSDRHSSDSGSSDAGSSDASEDDHALTGS
ncbi:PLD nuclease N-terminal domain-containing protein [Rhabdothermincola salaria]|uniref:PLD nuclease N-terminal domain-containing protein n=1 Tax=Rhabdothermincola salaria TaxID=2903142 RepID=UPI001E5E9733|nr:PLD nuclease N-terminal domain-containing protein [Rhabdothermincola salaria]MCD9623903.1 PLD nuclease N-terminal domain-containing protein [Rhabdothermincola salaria]